MEERNVDIGFIAAERIFPQNNLPGVIDTKATLVNNPGVLVVYFYGIPSSASIFPEDLAFKWLTNEEYEQALRVTEDLIEKKALQLNNTLLPPCLEGIKTPEQLMKINQRLLGVRYNREKNGVSLPDRAEFAAIIDYYKKSLLGSEADLELKELNGVGPEII